MLLISCTYRILLLSVPSPSITTVGNHFVLLHTTATLSRSRFGISLINQSSFESTSAFRRCVHSPLLLSIHFLSSLLFSVEIPRRRVPNSATSCIFSTDHTRHDTHTTPDQHVKSTFFWLLRHFVQLHPHAQRFRSPNPVVVKQFEQS